MAILVIIVIIHLSCVFSVSTKFVQSKAKIEKVFSCKKCDNNRRLFILSSDLHRAMLETCLLWSINLEKVVRGFAG